MATINGKHPSACTYVELKHAMAVLTDDGAATRPEADAEALLHLCIDVAAEISHREGLMDDMVAFLGVPAPAILFDIDVTPVRPTVDGKPMGACTYAELLAFRDATMRQIRDELPGEPANAAYDAFDVLVTTQGEMNRRVPRPTNAPTAAEIVARAVAAGTAALEGREPETPNRSLQ